MVSTETLEIKEIYDEDLIEAINYVNDNKQFSQKETSTKASLNKKMLNSAGMVISGQPENETRMLNSAGMVISGQPEKDTLVELKDVTTEYLYSKKASDNNSGTSLEMVILELTLACNQKCMHCLADAGKPCDKELTTRDVLKFIDDLNEAQVKTIAFSGGEPLMRKDFIEIARYASGVGLNIIIATNGTLLDDKLVLELKEMRINNIQISLDGINKKTYEQIRGVKGDYDKALKAIKLCKEHGLPVTTRMIIMKQNIGEVDVMMEFANATGIPCIASLLNVEGRASKGLFPSMGEYKNQMNSLHDLDQISLLPVFDKPCSNSCGLGNRMISVKPDGDIVPCVILRDCVIGNIRKDNIQSVFLESDVLREIRESTPDNIEECRGCEAKKRCLGGCKARAYRLNDDFISPDAAQCALFKHTHELPYIKHREHLPLNLKSGVC